MAGFGSVSLVQTAIGTLIDQRAVVLYRQPSVDAPSLTNNNTINQITKDLWGAALQYEELFAGLASGLGTISTIANITGTNPYGITYMTARVNVESDLCDHPIETGKVITDASIIQPVSATVEVAMPTYFAEKIYDSMSTMLEKKDTMIMLQTKYRVYKNLVLQNFTYTLDARNVDRTIFTLTLREIMEVEPYGEFQFLASNSQQMLDGSDSNTVSSGTQVAGA